MKKIILAAAALLAVGSTAFAGDQWVNPYVKSNGTYVQGYHRSTSDGSLYNNYSTQGNVNPYTGQQGTRNPYGTRGYSSGSTYGSGVQIQSSGVNCATSLSC